jgi:hypothetical protein
LDTDGATSESDRMRFYSAVFYPFHVTPNFAITPDVQAIVDPSLNPAKDTLWVFSLRTRITF